MNETIKKYLSEIGKAGGSVSGGRKAAARRENGKLGGRPRRNTQIEQDKPSREQRE